MSTPRWLGGAPAVAQVTSYEFGGTWEATDIVRLTIGTKTVHVVAGSTTVTTIVDTVVSAWNALSATVYPEFAEITASRSSNDLVLTADTAGKPFTCTITPLETGGGTADSQTIEGGTSATTGTNDTANSGPNVFGVAANWSGAAVPADGDDIVFDSGAIDLLYDLDQNAITPASITIEMGYTGKIGLPQTNTDNTASYPEYRERYLKLGNSGDAATTTINIGGGSGSGSQRINLDSGTGQVILNVLNSNTSAETGVPTINWKGTHASNVANIAKGDIGVARLAGESAAVATLNVGFVTNPAGDATVRCGAGVTLTTINQSGGIQTTNSNLTTVNMTGGELIHQAGTLGTLNCDAGDVRYKSTGTLTTGRIGSGGRLDFRQDPRSRTVTNLELYERSAYNDPQGTATITNGFDFVRCTPADLTEFEIVPHRTLTMSAI